VLRGGSWNNNAQNCRSANRNRNEPGNRNDNIGFRLARALFETDEGHQEAQRCPQTTGPDRWRSAPAPVRQ
jgi:hypothetical protein